MEWKKDQFIISDDKALINIEKVSYLLNSTYWAGGIKKETIEKGIANSHCFGIYLGEMQIGFARAISDKAVLTWIMDVIVDERFRGKGLGKWLIECILQHPELKNTKFRLATEDAHELYRKFGFTDEKIMIRPRMD